MKLGQRVLKTKKSANIYRFNKFNSIDIMQSKIENLLNPKKYYLSNEGKKRLKWMYVIHYECQGNISRAANKIGLSRQWLSSLHSQWERHRRDPRKLEPNSRAPRNTGSRKRIPQETEDKIVEVRKKYYWGKDKLPTVLKRDYQIKVGASTVNRYLHKHNLIDLKLSSKNKKAWQNRKQTIEQKQKFRPPKNLKDYKPGALVEKDMKFILKKGRFLNTEKYRAKENFWHQHTFVDSFTRIKATFLTEESDSQTAAKVHKQAEKRLPFKIACENTDSGGENGKDYAKHLQDNNIIHFYSRAGTPTDNPRVERAHLTDDKEFWSKGYLRDNLKEQNKEVIDWDLTYNYIRPHQALGNLTPIEFYELWKQNPDQAYSIKNKYQKYLEKQRKRLASSRRLKKQEQIEKLMQHIDKKLSGHRSELSFNS